jgi:lipopolysaccharide transport system permease protein
MARSTSGARARPPLPTAIFTSALTHNHLIGLLIRRNVEASFRGSVLGKLWAVLAPLLRLGLYTFVFGFVIGAKWPGRPRSHYEVALLYFVGLTLFDFFFDCINAAPGLMADNANFVKKVVFPLEILSFVTVGAALVRFCITACVVMALYLVIDGLPGMAALSIPLLLVPLILVVTGLVWIMAAVGTYVRDLRQLIALFSIVAMYLSPIFFPVAQVAHTAPWAVPVFYANPLTFVIESSRAALFDNQWPNWGALALYTLGAWAFASLSFRWFVRMKPGFADVL